MSVFLCAFVFWFKSCLLLLQLADVNPKQPQLEPSLLHKAFYRTTCTISQCYYTEVKKCRDTHWIFTKQNLKSPLEPHFEGCALTDVWCLDKQSGFLAGSLSFPSISEAASYAPPTTHSDNSAWHPFSRAENAGSGAFHHFILSPSAADGVCTVVMKL